MDIYGRPGQQSAWAGVQCKGKDGSIGAKLTKAELIAEVEKAKSFQPKLTEFIVATTAPNDIAIEKIAREITETHQEQGLFSVSVLGWAEIQRRLGDHAAVFQKYYRGIASALATALSPAVDAHVFNKTAQQLTEKLEEVSAIQRSLSAYQTLQDSAGSGLTAELSAELDYARDQIGALRPQEALHFLEKLRARVWERASNNLRFRIVTNIAAAHLALGREPRAAEGFAEAYQYQPDSEKAKCNFILSLLLTRQFERTVAEAKAATEAFPASARVWALLIQARAINESSVVPEAIPPKELLDDHEIAYAIAHVYGRRSDPDAALAWIRRAHASAPKERDIRVALAELSAESVVRAGRFFPEAPLSDSERKTLLDATIHLKEVWDQVRVTDVSHSYYRILFNLSSLYVVLGDWTNARIVVEEGLSLAPNNPDLLRQSAQLHLFSEEYHKARAILERITPTDIEDHPLLLSRALRGEGKLNEAISLLQPSIDAFQGQETRNAAILFLVDTIGESKGLEAAREFVEEFLSKDPQNSSLRAIYADLLRRAGDIGGAIAQLRAIEDCDPPPNSKVCAVVADVYFNLERYEDALRILNALDLASTDSYLLRKRLACLIGLDRRGDALRLIESLPRDTQQTLYYRKHVADIHINAGDFSRGLKELDACIVDAPHDLRLRIRWCEVLTRIGGTDRLRAFLTSFKLPPNASWQFRLAFAQLHGEYGDIRTALALAHESCRLEPNRPETHLALVSLVMFRQNIPEEITNPPCVAPDTVIGLKDSASVVSPYTITTDVNPDPLRHEFAVSHPFASTWLGKKIGDIVTVSKNAFFEDQRTVEWIKHKYIHAAVQTLENFETRFPQSQALQKAQFTGKDSIKQVLSLIDKRASAAHQLEDLYKTKHVPISSLAQISRLNILDVLHGLVVNPDHNVQITCCIGSQPERDFALNLLKTAGGKIIVDAIGLYIIHALQIGVPLSRTFGKLGVTEACLDTFRDLARERNIHPGGYLVVGKQGDHYVRQEISADAIEAEVTRLNEIVTWARENCEIVPVLGESGNDAEKYSALRQLLERGTLETIVAARTSGRILLSEDHNLRQLIKTELGVDGVWIQAALMTSLDAKHLTPAQYCDASYALIASNISFITVTAESLLYYARQENWRVTDKIRKVVSTLRPPTCNLDSALRIAGKFLTYVWQQREWYDDGPTIYQQQALTFLMLDQLGAQSRDYAGAIFGFLIHGIQLGRFPGAFVQTLREWCEGHFLPWPPIQR